MKKFLVLFAVFSGIALFATSASAVSVGLYANPHNGGKSGNGAGVSAAVQVTDKVDLSINYLDTDINGGGNQTWDARVGVSAPIVGKLSALAEVGYGAPYRNRTYILPIALGLRYPVTRDVTAVAKGTRSFMDSANHPLIQWTIGALFSF